MRRVGADLDPAEVLAEIPVVLGFVPTPREGPERYDGGARRIGCEGEPDCLLAAARLGWVALDCRVCPVFGIVPPDLFSVTDEVAWRHPHVVEPANLLDGGDVLRIRRACDRFEARVLRERERRRG